MIKQSFLDSLTGLFLDQADALVEAEGHTAYSVPDGCAMTLEAKPNTVVLWMNNFNQVELADAGDPSELENDT